MMRMRAKILSVFGGAMLLALSISTLVGATSSWIDSRPSASYLSSFNYACSARPRSEDIMVATTNLDPQTLTYSKKISAWCVEKGLNFMMANTADGYYIKFDNDLQYHALRVTGELTVTYGSNVILQTIFTSDSGYSAHNITAYRDIREALEVQTTNAKGVVTSFGLNTSRGIMLINESSAVTRSSHDVSAGVASADGRYVLVRMDGREYVKVDLNTGEATTVIRSNLGIGGIYVGLTYPGALSETGRYAYIAGGEEMIDTQNCGDSILPRFDPYVPMTNPCKSQNIATDALYRSTVARFIDDYTLYVHLEDNRGGYTNRMLLAGGSEDESRLDYLALGDSYSSGEGDVEKDATGKNHYLPLTDLGSDTCHVSSRSYPFLLREQWNINQASMKSVACSGAQVVMDYYRPLKGYLGQDNRLQGRDDIEQAQETALNKFIPGRIPQLEFVKKYKPKTITLTGGGNDVGFPNMLGYCAYGSSDIDTPWKLIKEGFFGMATCEYAKSGSFLQRLTLRAIDDQFYYTVSLLKQIKEYDSDANIYIIGYPSFISPNTAICTNSLELDSDERAAIQYYLERLNDSLRRAANSEGVEFIDITSSLEGGRLCEGSKYMTGLWDVNASDKIEMHNLFHPNAIGHQKIANMIHGKIDNPDTGSTSWAQKPLSVGDTEYSGSVQNREVVADDLPRNGSTVIGVEPYLFQPESDITLTLHSNPIDLGVLTTASDGSIHQQISLHDLPAGYHVLTLEGKSYSGEPLTVYQFVTVGLDEDRPSLLSPSDSNEVAPRASQDVSKLGAGDTPVQAVSSSITTDGNWPSHTLNGVPGLKLNMWQPTENQRNERTKEIQSPLVWFAAGIGVLAIVSVIYTIRKRRS